jgi:cytochrome b subunit of formate dehydrogenase
VVRAVLVVAVLAFPGLASAQDVDTCMMCHGDPANFEGLPNAEQLAVSIDTYTASMHGEMGMTCVDCHQDLVGDEDFEHAGGGQELQPVDCSMCHPVASEQFETSLHGYSLARGNPRAPTCASCHTTHEMYASSDPRSSTHRFRLPDTCSVCHGTAGLLTDQMVKLPSSTASYALSVHGQGAGRGLAAAASCQDCHEVHDLRSVDDPESPIYPKNVSATCGQCHPDIQIAYDRSIHGRALQAGIHDSPTCTGCHGEHMILSPHDTDAKTSAGNLATQTCGTCHADPVINAKYNLRGDVVGSYVDSYHGWAVRRDYEDAANCVSCHTTHEVLPESDPASSIHPDNVVATCGQCHENSDARFAASYTHLSASEKLNPVNRIIKNIYIMLIIVVIGGMLLHNFIIMNFHLVEAKRAHQKNSWVLRFDMSQVIQHLLLFVSFTMLVITGFALRFPDAWWARQLQALGMTEPARANLHRVFAVIMVAASLYHVWYLAATRRGREELRAMLPGFGDVKEFIGNIKYHTWLSRRAVKFGRYDYTQKAEYWALIWGTAIMALTGFILWFPAEASGFLPAWAVPAAQTIHFYEAWLATLAILIWHFFFVIFHPSEYPMSWTWLTGKMSEHSVKTHHARWYEEEIAAPTERRSNRADSEL